MRIKQIHNPKPSQYLKKIYGFAMKKKVLKRSMSGYEVEMTLIDDTGSVVNEAEKIIKKVRKTSKDFPIYEELGKNMLEIAALPHKKIKKTARGLLDNISRVMDVCEEENLYMFPFGTYPGRYETEVWNKDRYKYLNAIFKTPNYTYYASHSFGFHYHYALPKGTFNEKEKYLNQLMYSRTKKTLLDSYNFMIAADPVITTLAQSSPYDGGKYYAKDTRLLFQRGGKRLKYNGLGYKMQLFRGLQPYKQTMSDLLASLEKKNAKIKRMLAKGGAPKSFLDKKEKLDYVWNPVKINKLGTMEHRAMDTNFPEINLGISIMLKFILRAIQQDFYHVIPSDIGIEEPFKLEGNVIFIPSHTHVRHKWQTVSSYEGLSNNEFSKICNRFYNLSRKLVYDNYKEALKPIGDMLRNRETMSDIIVKYMRRKGVTKKSEVTDEVARSMALLYAKKMRKQIEKVKKTYEILI